MATKPAQADAFDDHDLGDELTAEDIDRISRGGATHLRGVPGDGDDEPAPPKSDANETGENPKPPTTTPRKRKSNVNKNADAVDDLLLGHRSRLRLDETVQAEMPSVLKDWLKAEAAARGIPSTSQTVGLLLFWALTKIGKAERPAEYEELTEFMAKRAG